jgi:hypothetical protein
MKRKEDIMEEKKGKKKWYKYFLNFLIYGGWLLIVAFIIGIITLVSILTK